MEVNIQTAEVLSAIGQLPEAQRETVLLVYAEGYTYAEAATALGVPIGTIMSRLAAARGSARETEIGAYEISMPDDDERLAALIDNELDERGESRAARTAGAGRGPSRPPRGASAGSRSACRIL